MKTKLTILLLVIVALSSCNTAKQYANYRFGGKSDREEKIILKEIESEDVTLIIPEKIKTDSVSPEIAMVKEIKTESNSIREKEKSTETIRLSNEFVSSTQESKIMKVVKNEKLPLVQYTKAKIQKNKNLHFSKNKDVTASDILDTFIGILLVASLIFTIITYLASVNFAIADVILIGLALILGILLCIGLGKLIMGMFPGMSKKKKNLIANFLDKISFVKRKNKSGMKYYGGMTVKEYFWIGLGVLALAVIVMAIVGASDLGWSIIMGLLGIHLAICVMAALVVGLLSLFPGMSIKKK